MAGKSYWKAWIGIVVLLGFTRLLTMSFSASSSSSAPPSPPVQTQQVLGSTQQTPPQVRPIQISPTNGTDKSGFEKSNNSSHSRDKSKQTLSTAVPVPSVPRQNTFPITKAEGAPVQYVPSEQPARPAIPTDNSLGHGFSAPVGESLRPYFTLGSSKSEVLRVQGTPTKLTDSEWNYGLSEVYFLDGQVVSWRIYPGSPLHARMLPFSPVSNLGYFTIGSTKDEVLAVQGTPTKVAEYEWDYGLSEVHFRSGRVSSWRVYPGSPLLAKMLPSSSVLHSRDYFTIGSTKDEVLTVQGTPTHFAEYEWDYGLSEVRFRDGRVASWRIFPGSPLRVRLLPSSPVLNQRFFTVGSTKDEVLAVQGTPTEVGDYEWGYGLSEVYFKDGRVVSWKIFPGSPLRALGPR